MSWPRFSGHSWPMTISSGVHSPPSIIGRCDGGLPISREKTRYDRCQEVRANYFRENEGDDGDNDDNLDHLRVDTSQQIMIKITKVRMMMMMFNTNAIIVMLIIGPLQVAIHVVQNRHAMNE